MPLVNEIPKKIKKNEVTPKTFEMLVKYPGLLQMAISQVPNLSLRSFTLSKEDTLILITFVVKCMIKKSENKILESENS